MLGEYGLHVAFSDVLNITMPVRYILNKDFLQLFSIIIHLVFSHGFSEASQLNDQLALTPKTSESGFVMNEFEDSDDEEDEGPERDVSHIEAEHAISRRSSFSIESLSTSVLDNAFEDTDNKGETQTSQSITSSPPDAYVDIPMQEPDPAPNHKAITVVVKDVAYTTYYAILYYVRARS